jgi:hypothetical protein
MTMKPTFGAAEGETKFAIGPSVSAVESRTISSCSIPSTGRLCSSRPADASGS